MSTLSTKLTSPQDQEAILKEPIRIIRNWNDIKLGHSLKDFYCPMLTKRLKLTLNSLVTVENQNMLQPTLAKDDFPPTMSLAQKCEKFSCTLMAKGTFLESVQSVRGENDFEGISFSIVHSGSLDTKDEGSEDEESNKDRDIETLEVKADSKRETYHMLQESRMPLAVMITTTFGLITAMLNGISIKTTPQYDTHQEIVANLLSKSLFAMFQSQHQR